MINRGKKTLLLVEDEVLIAMSEKAQLEKYGYSVKTASTGEQAVELINSTPFDLMLMDINLGKGKNGTETAEAILKDHDIPIVFLSSHIEPEIVEKTEKITSYGYVVKNSSITVLDASIKMAFKLYEAKIQEQEKEKSILESNTLNEQIINSTKEGIIVYGLDLRYKVWNHFMENHTGLKSNEVVGKHPLELFPFLKDSGIIERLEMALAGEEPCIIETPFTVPSTGRSGWGSDKNVPLRNAKGEIIGVIGTVHDISERKNAENALKESEKKYRLQFDNSKSYNSLYEVLTDKDARPYDFRFVMVNHAYENYVGKEASELIGKTLLEVYPETEQYWIDKMAEAVLYDNALHFEAYSKVMKTYTEFSLFVPQSGYLSMTTENITERRNAEIALQTKNEEYEALNEELRSTVEELQAASEELQQQNEELRHYRDSLLQSETQFSLFMDYLPAIVFLKDSEGRTLFTNKYMNTSLGASDWKGMKMTEVFPNAFGEKLLADDMDVLKAGYRKIEEAIPHIDGSLHFYETQKFVIKKSINESLIGGVSLDITERKKSQDRLENVLIGAKAGTWDWNIQTGVASLDEASANLLGYTVEELSPDTFKVWRSLKHEDDVKTMDDLLMKHVRGETEYYSNESRMRHKDGHWVWIQGRGKVSEFDENGKPLRMFGTHVDVTERKNTELAIMAEQHLMNALMDNVQDLIYFKDKDSKFIKVNAAYANTFQYASPTELEGKSDFDIFGNDVAQKQFEDEQYVMQTGLPIFKEESASWGKNNRKLWSLTTKMPLRDKDGIIVGTFGISTNIAELKNAEEKVKILLTEKERMLKEVHHRIKNNMGIMVSLLQLQMSTMKDAQAINALRDAENRLNSMGLLYDKLYRSDDYGMVSAKEYLPTLAKEVVAVFANGAFVSVESEVEDFNITTKMMSSLGIMVNEIITNSMKYAFPKNNKDIIRIEGTKTGTKVKISIGDNGIGIPAGIEVGKTKGFGMILIDTLTKQLGGTSRIERNNGTTFVLEFESKD